jgi:hypothetical protein
MTLLLYTGSASASRLTVVFFQKKKVGEAKSAKNEENWP